MRQISLTLGNIRINRNKSSFSSGGNLYITCQTLPNIIKIFQNAYCISRSGVESSFCTPSTCLQHRRIQNPFKHLSWCVLTYPVNDFKLLVVSAKTLPLEYACIQITGGNVLCYHSKHLMGYFKFLNDSRIICLPLNISEKLYWQRVFERLEEAETHRFYLC